MVVLGCYLDGSGSTETQVKGRLDQGRKMFGELRPLLCCPRNPEEERIKNVLHHGGFKRLVGFGMLDSVVKSPAAHINSGKQVAPLHAGRAKISGRPVGGLVSHNKTLCAGVEMQTKPSVLVAQSVGSCVWMGWTRGSERHLPSRTCCNSVAKCEMVGDHEKRRGWLPRPDLATSQEKLGPQL